MKTTWLPWRHCVFSVAAHDAARVKRASRVHGHVRHYEGPIPLVAAFVGTRCHVIRARCRAREARASHDTHVRVRPKRSSGRVDDPCVRAHSACHAIFFTARSNTVGRINLNSRGMENRTYSPNDLLPPLWHTVRLSGSNGIRNSVNYRTPKKNRLSSNDVIRFLISVKTARVEGITFCYVNDYTAS